MITWMQHPDHGKHPAQQSEIEALELSGWTICPPKQLHKADDHLDLIKAAIKNSLPPRDKIRGNRKATR